MGFESCHPAVNLLFFSAVLFGAAAFSHPIFLAVAFLASFAYSLRRLGVRALRLNLALLPLAALFALCYAATHHFGVTVLTQNFIGNRLTLESLAYGGVLALRAAAVCMWLRCLFQIFTTDKVVYLMGRVSPRMALFMCVLLRFLPRLRVQAGRIHTAQRGIGRAINQGSILRRCAKALRIFSMLISWSIGALAAASDSMNSRGSTLRGRTAFSVYRFDNRDRAFTVALCAGIILTAMGMILGATAQRYDPTIAFRALDPLERVTAAGYIFLCFLPMGMEHFTHWRYRCAQKTHLPV